MFSSLRKSLTLALIICTASAAAEPVQIAFWHSMTGDKGATLQKLVEEFNKRPDILPRFQIRMTYVGAYTDGVNKIRASLIAKKVPHIAQIYEIGTQFMIDSKAITPVEDLLKPIAGPELEQILPQVSKYYRINDKLYSLPFATSNPILYYNVEWLNKAGIKNAPKNWEELEADAQKLSDPVSGKSGLTWPLNGWFFEQQLARQGALYVDHENGRAGRAEKANFASPEGIRYVELIQRLIKNKHFANVGRDWDPPVQNFMAQRSAMLVMSTSDVFVITGKAPFKVGAAPIPIPKETADRPSGTLLGGNSLWVMNLKPETEQKMAAEFLKFILSPSTQRTWHSRTGYFPIRKDVIVDLDKEGFYKKNPNARVAIDQLVASANVPATNGALLGVFPETRLSVENAIEEVISGKSDVKSALEKAATKSESAFARYNRSQRKR